MKKSILLLTLIILNVDIPNAQNNFWGVTSKGGASNAGTIYTTDMQGKNLTVKFNSELINNAYLPSEYTGMVEHPESGEIYVVSEEGGKAQIGGLFKFNPISNEFSKLIDFTGVNGKRPHGGLLFASNNKIYGTTKDSDADTTFPNGTGGSLFEFDPATSTFKTLHKFSESDGKNPYATLFEASNGNIYGTTSGGGSNNNGVLFEFNAQTKKTTVVHSFLTGKAPYGGVVEANNKLYGATSLGGSADRGVIYEYDLNTKALTLKVHLTSTHTGYMKGSFVNINNELYAVTNGNQQVTGAYGKLIKYLPGETSCSILHSFMIFTSGIYPIGGLCKVGNVLVGTLEGGPLTPRGTIFEFDTDANANNQFSYTALNSLAQIDLKGTLLNSTNGVFGLTKSAGTTNNGSIYSYNRSDANKSITDEVSFKIDILGSNPVGKITRAADGKLYGNMRTGGKNRNGVLFSFDPIQNKYNIEHDFPKDSKPNGSMALVGNNRLYGMSEFGGEHNQGYIFEYNTNSDQFNIIHNFDTTLSDHKSFNDLNLGAIPKAGFTVVNDSILYGTTSKGGFANEGMLFKIVASKHTSINIEKLVSFDVPTGSEPTGDLELDGDFLYGMTYNGGTLVPGGGQGTIFRYQIGGSYEPLVAFQGGDNGEYPMGTMTLHNHKLYASTHGKLYNNAQLGVLFEYDPANQYTHNVVHNYIGSSSQSTSVGGSKPFGKMTESTNGKLYGTTSTGSGISGTGGDFGVIFEFDPSNNTYKSVETFTGPNGATPGINAELEIVCNADARVTVDQANNQLKANEANADSYQWYSVNTNTNQRTLIANATTKNYSPATSGTFSVEVEKNGCSNYSDYYYIEIEICNADATFSIDEDGKTLVANDAEATSYQWYEENQDTKELTEINGAINAAFTPVQSGNYVLEVSKDGCSNISKSQFFEFIPECDINTQVDFDAENELFTALESDADLYQWYSVNTVTNERTPVTEANNRAFAPDESGDYLVEISAGQCTDISIVQHFEKVIICQLDTTLSVDEDLHLITSNQANASYQWYEKNEQNQQWEAIANETQRIFTPNYSGNFKVEINKDECTSFSETLEYDHEIICTTNASISYDYDLKIFVANEANATAYQWYTVSGDPEVLAPISGETKRTFAPKSSGNYKAEVTKNSCSNFSETYTFENEATCNTNASANYNTDLNIFIANEANASNYQWYEIIEESMVAINGENGRAYTPDHTGEYVVEVTKNNCSNYSEPMYYEHVTSCSTDASASFNEGLKILIANEPSADKYQWFEVDTNGGLIIISNATHRTYTPIKSALYKLEVTKGGCSNFSDELEYDINANCQTDASVIYKEELQLFIASEPDAYLYQWFKVSPEGLSAIVGENNRSFSPPETGYYAVEVSKNGCSNLSQEMYFEYTETCNTIAAIYYRSSNHSLEATEMNADSYTWFIANNSGVFEPIPGADTRVYFPTKSGQFKVSVSKDECEKLSESMEYAHYIDCTLEANVSLASSGTELVASVNNATQYQWYEWIEVSKELQLLENETGNSFTPLKTGAYLVEITVDDCSDFSSPIQFEYVDPCDFSPLATLIEENQIMLNNNVNAASYQWFSVNMDSNEYTPINGATSQSYSPQTTGTYIAQVTLQNACAQYSNQVFYEEPFVCELETSIVYDISLHAFTTNDSGDLLYQWYTTGNDGNEAPIAIAGATEQIFAPEESGYYLVEVTLNTEDDCSAISSALMYVKPGSGCDIYATLKLDKELNALVANDAGSVLYEWFVKDELTGELSKVSGENTRIFTPSTTGYYVVKIDDGDCSEISNEVYYEASNSVTEANSSITAQIYPNPASQFITLNTTTRMEQVELHTLSGKRISIVNPNQNTWQLDVSQLTNGIYFITIDYKKGNRETLKFIKRGN